MLLIQEMFKSNRDFRIYKIREQILKSEDCIYVSTYSPVTSLYINTFWPRLFYVFVVYLLFADEDLPPKRSMYLIESYDVRLTYS